MVPQSLPKLLRWSRWERGRGWHDDWFGGFDLDALDLFASTSATYDFVECRTHVLDQVEPVRHLHGVGRTTASSIGVRAAAIARDHFDARMRLQPFNQWVGIARGEHVDWLVSLHIDEHRGVTRPATQRKIIDAQDAWRGNGCDPEHLDEPEQRIWAGRHTGLSGQSRPTLATSPQPEFSQQTGCLVRAARTTREKTLKSLGEDAARTTYLVAKPAPTADAQAHRGATPRQVHGSTHVPAVLPSAQDAARWTRHCFARRRNTQLDRAIGLGDNRRERPPVLVLDARWSHQLLPSGATLLFSPQFRKSRLLPVVCSR
jgi:hypothetical protein